MNKALAKALLTFITAICLIIGVVPISAVSPVSAVESSAASSEAATKPARPVLGATVTAEGNGVKLTIGKTEGADGYRIYMKAPGATSFKLIRTLKKSGTAVRTFTKKNLEDGSYSFKVRAYHTVNGKKVWSSYSKAVTLMIAVGGNQVRDTSNDLASVIARTPEIIEFVNPTGYFGPESISTDDHRIPCYYDFQLKTGEVLPDGTVYRLFAIDHNGTGFVPNVPAFIDEKSASVAPHHMGSLTVMIFAYASEADADNKVNPIARSEALDIVIGEEDLNEKYADITFKNGYAYFGSYPQNKVTNASVISALNGLTKSTDYTLYNGKKYQYGDSSKAWFEEAPIEWVILEGSADSDTVTLMSNKILLECGYSDWSGFEKGGYWKDSFVRYQLNRYNGSFKSIWSYDFLGTAFEGDMQRVLLEQN